MRVSFDLDETLFVNPSKSDVETVPGFFWQMGHQERLRKGFVQLFSLLKGNGIEVWVYTTSFRSVSYIESYFKKFGIRFDGIVNGYIHRDQVQGNKTEIQPSKYPPKFRIDLHVDDDNSVKANGDSLGFQVLILKEDDPNWANRVLEMLGKKFRLTLIST